jgi:hypothetical protein
MADDALKLRPDTGPLPASEISHPGKPELAAAIKQKVRDVWAVQKQRDPSLTKTGLGEKLGLTSSAVSKLINNDDSHIWTVDALLIFCAYCNVPIDNIVGSKSELHGFFNSFSSQPHQPKQAVLDESYKHARDFFNALGVEPSVDRMARIVYDVACLVEHDEKPDFDFAVRKIVASITAK